jgi:TatD DNase family protein
VNDLRFVDAHIHLSDEEYIDKPDEIVAEAKQSNVVALVSNSMDLKTCMDNLKLAEKYPQTIYLALGIHPRNVQMTTEDDLRRTLSLIKEQRHNKSVVAIGEIGLDNKYNTIWEKQLNVFTEMLRLAERLDLPVVIHSRGTTVQVLDILQSYRLKRVLLHWFSDPITALPKAIERGYYITEGPPTVYSNGIRRIVEQIPLANLLTETDGPVHYFKPPFKGKRTTPAFIPTIIKAIADIKQSRVDEVADQIVGNFERFFRAKLN